MPSYNTRKELMSAQSWIIVVILVVANVTLIVSEVIRYYNIKKDIKELRSKKEAEMYDRSGADSLETLKEDDLKDEIEPKQVHIWILGVVVCLNIWILGAVATHWWATTFFADQAKRGTLTTCNVADDCGGTTEGNDATTRGLFGDSFGAVNALVSALAFAGMIVAFVLQRYELRLQRKELRDSRAEMRRQTKQFKTQNANLEIQRLENTFFHMLELHKQNLQEIDIQGIKGRDAFVKLIDQIKRIYYAVEYATTEIRNNSLVGVLRSENPHNILNSWSIIKVKHFNIEYAYGLFFYGEGFHITNISNDETRIIEDAVLKLSGDKIKEAYDLVLNSQKQGASAALGHYYRHIYQTVCFVDNQDKLEPEAKYAYVKMLRAQLSDYEQILFYYNTMSLMGHPWLEKKEDGLSLITRYRMIKNIPHFFDYFFIDPCEQFKDEIALWKEKHPDDSFFEQIVQS